MSPRFPVFRAGDLRLITALVAPRSHELSEGASNRMTSSSQVSSAVSHLRPRSLGLPAVAVTRPSACGRCLPNACPKVFPVPRATVSPADAPGHPHYLPVDSVPWPTAPSSREAVLQGQQDAPNRRPQEHDVPPPHPVVAYMSATADKSSVRAMPCSNPLTLGTKECRRRGEGGGGSRMSGPRACL